MRSKCGFRIVRAWAKSHYANESSNANLFVITFLIEFFLSYNAASVYIAKNVGLNDVHFLKCDKWDHARELRTTFEKSIFNFALEILNIMGQKQLLGYFTNCLILSSPLAEFELIYSKLTSQIDYDAVFFKLGKLI